MKEIIQQLEQHISQNNNAAQASTSDHDIEILQQKFAAILKPDTNQVEPAFEKEKSPKEAQ